MRAIARKVAVSALASAIGSVVLSADVDRWFDGMTEGLGLEPERRAALKQELIARCREAAERGRIEKDFVVEVARHLLEKAANWGVRP